MCMARHLTEPNMPAPPAAPPSLWRAMMRSELKTLVVTSVWLYVCLQYFVPFLLLLPLTLVPGKGKGWYRHLTGVYDYYARLAVCCIPCCKCDQRKVYVAPDGNKFLPNGLLAPPDCCQCCSDGCLGVIFI